MKTWMIWGIAILTLPCYPQESVSVDSRVVSATVFQNRAMVTREGKIDLAAGTNALVFGPLTPDLMDESVRVTGEGTAPVKIVDVKIETEYTAEIQEAKKKELQGKLDALKLEQQGVQDKISVLETEKTFIESLKAESAKEINKTLVSAAPNTQNWQSMLMFFNKNLTDIYGQIRTHKVEDAELQKKIDALQKELNDFSPSSAERFKNILVTVELKTPGRVTLRPSYMAGRSSWYPIYDVRVDPETKKMDLTYYGMVRQNTGEDWKDVQLTLSTAQPVESQNIPNLYPWYIDLIQPRKLQIRTAGTGVLMKQEEMAATPQMIGEIQTDVYTPSVAISQHGTATVFILDARNTIPSDGEPHKTTIAIETLESNFEYVSIPKLAEKVFLKGMAVNRTDAPFLPGETSIFVQGDFVTKTGIPYIAQNDTLSLALGVDENIRVERKLINRFAEKRGLLGGKERITFTYEIHIENHHKTAETIQVLDQLPISQNEKIKVRLLEPVEDSIKMNAQNQIEWKVLLKPGERKILPFKFEVEYPEGTDINL